MGAFANPVSTLMDTTTSPGVSYEMGKIIDEQIVVVSPPVCKVYHGSAGWLCDCWWLRMIK